VAILKREPDWRRFARALDQADTSRLSAATYVEISVVVERLKDPALNREIDELIEHFEIELEPLTVEQAKIALHAYHDYGRGSGHPEPQLRRLLQLRLGPRKARTHPLQGR
jgi:ribonuclease VapC